MAKILNSKVSAHQPITVGNSKELPFRFMLTLVLGCVVLLGLTDLPVTSILLVDAMFCWFCATVFTHRLRYLFLLHPFVVLVLSLFYQTSFLELGDGEAYFALTRDILPFYTGEDTSEFIHNYINDPIGSVDFKQVYLGFIPNVVVPDYIYGTPSDDVYFFWQATFYVILFSLSLVLAKQWRVMHDEYLFCFALFAVISPSFFELGSAPTRHLFTFISVWLFYIAFIATVKQPRPTRIAWLFVAVAAVAVSRIVLLIPIIVFTSHYLLAVKNKTYVLTRYILVAVVVALLFYFMNYFFGKAQDYRDISQAGAGTFAFLANIPVVSFFGKYLFAMLSPFPWSKATIHINEIYGGNSLIFMMHVLSSITGLYFFTRIIVYARPLAEAYPELKPPIVYGLIMSLSILGGSTGFHSYILIYFPFFSPLFVISRYRISWMVPVGIAVGVETLYTISILFA